MSYGLAFQEFSTIREIAQNGQESVTLAHKSITSDHASIHAGEGFSAWVYVTNLANDGTHNITFQTPTTTVGLYNHLKLISCWTDQAQVWVDIYETPSAFTAGTATTIINRRRIGTPNPSVSAITYGATTTLGATPGQVEKIVIGGGGLGAGRIGGDRPLDLELVMKPSTTYVVQLTNKSGVGTDADILITFFWYEEERA